MAHLFKNNKGFTLIEVLAVLTLLSVITLVGAKLYDSTTINDNKTSNLINQQQETNHLLQKINQAYKDDSVNIGDIQYQTSDNITINKVIANGQEEPFKNTIQNVNHNKPLHLIMITENESGNIITIDTTFIPNTTSNIILK